MHGRVLAGHARRRPRSSPLPPPPPSRREPGRQPGRGGRPPAPPTARPAAAAGLDGRVDLHRRQVRRAGVPHGRGRRAPGRRRELLRRRPGRRGLARASQTIDVSAAAAGDRRGQGRARRFSALIGGYDGQDDQATVTATPLNAVGRRHRAGDDARAGARRPSAQRRRTCCRARRRFAVPAGTRAISVAHHRDALRRQLQRRLRRQRQPVLRRRHAGRRQERRAPRRSAARVLVKRAGQREFVALDAVGASRTAPRSTRARASSRSPRCRRRRRREVLRRHLQAPPGGRRSPTLTLSEKLTGCSRKAQRRGGEAEDAQAVGRRQGQVPHQRPVQRGDRPRHQVARPGHLHEHAHAGHRRAP